MSKRYTFDSHRIYQGLRMSRDTAEQAQGNTAYGGTCNFCGEYDPHAATLPGGRGVLCCEECWYAVDKAEREAYETEE